MRHKIDDLRKLHLLVALAHIGAAIGLVYLWDAAWLLLSLVGFFLFFWVGHDLYNHRYLSHGAFFLPRWMQVLFALLGVYALFGTPIGIASAHALHHKHADTDSDPHPAHHGWQAWFWTYPAMRSTDIRTVKRLTRDRWLVFLSRNYFKLYVGTVVLSALVSPKFALYFFLVPVVYSFFCNSLINVVCHTAGYRRYATADNSRNNLWVNAALLFSGIALHNTHHARPRAYYLSKAWYEIDGVGLLIKIISRRATNV